MYTIVFSLNFLTVTKLSTERHFIVWAAKLNQHIYIKGILASKFESKHLLLWKRHCFHGGGEPVEFLQTNVE